MSIYVILYEGDKPYAGEPALYMDGKRVSYQDRAVAEAEAKKLVKKTGKTYFVAQIVTRLELASPPVEIIRLDREDTAF